MKEIQTLKMSEVVNRNTADFSITYEMVGDIKIKHFPGSLLNFAYEWTNDFNDVFCDIFPEFKKKGSNELVEPNKWIPSSGTADMWIVSDRNKGLHYSSISLGRKCYLMRGKELVAIGSITRISQNLKKAV